MTQEFKVIELVEDLSSDRTRFITATEERQGVAWKDGRDYDSFNSQEQALWFAVNTREFPAFKIEAYIPGSAWSAGHVLTVINGTIARRNGRAADPVQNFGDKLAKRPLYTTPAPAVPDYEALDPMDVRTTTFMAIRARLGYLDEVDEITTGLIRALYVNDPNPDDNEVDRFFLEFDGKEGLADAIMTARLECQPSRRAVSGLARLADAEGMR